MSTFWINTAREALPNLAWAINELPSDAGVDDIAVELEVITGSPAINTRIAILQEARYGLAAEKNPITFVGAFDIRLAAWMLAHAIDRASNDIEVDVSVYTDAIRAWCREATITKEMRLATARLWYNEQDNARSQLYFAVNRAIDMCVDKPGIEDRSAIARQAEINLHGALSYRVNLQMARSVIRGTAERSVLTFPALER